MADIAQNNQGPNAVNTVLPGGTGNTGGLNFTVGGPSDPNPMPVSDRIALGYSSVVNSSVLAPQAPLSYVSPNPTVIPSVDGLNADGTLSPTASEKAQSDLTSRLEALNNEMVGKSTYQQQQNDAAGIGQLNQQQQDLSTQLAQLQNEAKAIPQQLQTDSTGRGITAAGLSSLQSAALRNNAVRALGVSSMLDATKGLLASAQAKADKAVAAKYDPIQEEINAATANLKLIQNDPNTSLADKNRAIAQLQIQQQKQAQLDQQKQNAKDVNSIALEAAKNGADALTLQKITNAPDQASAIQAAGSFLQPKQNNQVVQLKDGNAVLVNPSTGQVIKNLGGAPPPGLDVSNLIGTPALDETNNQTAGSGKAGDILSATGLSLPVFNYLTQGTGALSRMTSADRMAVMKAAGTWAKQNGIDVSTLQSQYKAYNDVLSKNIERANNTSIFANEVAGSADALLSVIQSNDLGQSGGFFGIGGHSWKSANIAALAAGKEVNDPVAQKYSFQLQAMTNDLAGYFAASRGSNVPENADIEDAAKVIADGLNAGSTQAFKEAIQANEEKVNKVVSDAVSRAQQQVWGLFGVGDQYQSPAAASHGGINLPGTASSTTSGSTYNGVSLPN